MGAFWAWIVDWVACGHCGRNRSKNCLEVMSERGDLADDKIGVRVCFSCLMGLCWQRLSFADGLEAEFHAWSLDGAVSGHSACW